MGGSGREAGRGREGCRTIGIIEDAIFIGAKSSELGIHYVQLRQMQTDLLMQFESAPETPPDLRESTIVHAHDRIDRVTPQDQDPEAQT